MLDELTNDVLPEAADDSLFDIEMEESALVQKKSSDFRGDNLCITKREHEDLIIESRKDSRYDNAIAVKTIIHQMLHGEMERNSAEARDMIDQCIMDDSLTVKTDELRREELCENVMRYINCETRTPMEGIKRKHIRKAEYSISVKPDEVFDTDKEGLEAVIYKAGSPNVTQTGNKRDASVETCVELYLLLEYLKTLVPAGKTRTIKASYYFLKKPGDSSNRNPDFFKAKNGKPDKNVVTLTDVYTNTGGEEVKTDIARKLDVMINEYAVGRECSGDDCEHCQFNCACNYVKPPEVLVKKETRKKADVSYTEAQERVISMKEGIARVIAGAGAGKTETVTERVVRLVIDAGGNDISKIEAMLKKILMITFTDAGCKEMKSRVNGKLMKRGIFINPAAIQAKTFNSFAYEIILADENYKEVGYTLPPHLLDDIKNKTITTELANITEVPGVNYRHFEMDTPTVRGALSCLIASFDILKGMDRNLDLANDTDRATAIDFLREGLMAKGMFAFMSEESLPVILDMYSDYSARLLAENRITFADQEPMMFSILNSKKDYFEQLGYEHIIVDEFQDSNRVQMETIKYLTDTKCFKSLMVVGDDSQSIFSFRYTSPEFILNFFDYLGKQGEDLYLVDNYRSTPQIIGLANKLNARNENRMDKDLVSKREDGAEPILRGFDNQKEEYQYIAEKIKYLITEKGYYPDEIAFIAATNKELVQMSAVLAEAGIPWVMMNPMKLVENSRVQAALALADGIRNPEATAELFTYLTAVHNGDIMKLPTEQVQEEIAKLQASINSVFYGMGDETLSFEEQREIFHRYLNDIKGNDEIYQYFLEILYANADIQSELEYTLDFRRFGDKEAKRMLQTYEGVVLTTAHSSKGLEWRVVFNSLSKYFTERLHGTRAKVEEIEEKRRLLFVSLTRARDLLYVTGEYVSFQEAEKGSTSKEKNDVYNQFLREVFEDAGKIEEYRAGILAMLQRRADKENEARELRNKRARERNAAKKSNKLAGYTNNLPGQLKFVI